jgi:small subunit ribosomal protein S15
MALDSAKKSELVAQFGNTTTDTGSPAVQIAIRTARIVELTEHLKINPKDHSSRLGLLKLVGQRRRLMRYLKKKDFKKYTEVIQSLGLRDRV